MLDQRSIDHDCDTAGGGRGGGGGGQGEEEEVAGGGGGGGKGEEFVLVSYFLIQNTQCTCANGPMLPQPPHHYTSLSRYKPEKVMDIQPLLQQQH